MDGSIKRAHNISGPAAISDANIRHLARVALADFAVIPSHLIHLASHHNDVFRVDTEKGSRFLLRIQNDVMTDSQAVSQLHWLKFLSLNTDVRVPVPVSTSDLRPFTYIQIGAGKRRAVLLHWLPGQRVRSRADSFFIAATEMIAKLHNAAERFHPPRDFSCRQLDANWLFGPGWFLRNPNAVQYLTRSHRKIAHRAEVSVRDSMSRLGQRKHHVGIIHADLNPSNIITHADELAPIDFDEFGKGYYLFDLAEQIRTSITPQNWRQRRELALIAYTNKRPLNEKEVELFDAFMVATFVAFVNWAFTHARNPDDLKWVNFSLDIITRILG
jgi:Ser/Thr protein kinase RdoA (MazF antagonist)